MYQVVCFFVSLFGFYFIYNFLYFSVLGTQEGLAIWALKFNETNDWVVGDVVTNSINLGILIIGFLIFLAFFIYCIYCWYKSSKESGKGGEIKLVISIGFTYGSWAFFNICCFVLNLISFTESLFFHFGAYNKLTDTAKNWSLACLIVEGVLALLAVIFLFVFLFIWCLINLCEERRVAVEIGDNEFSSDKVYEVTEDLIKINERSDNIQTSKNVDFDIYKKI